MPTIAELVDPKTLAKLEKLRVRLANQELKRRVAAAQREREARRAAAEAA